MQTPPPKLTETSNPTTFRSRGVAAPFTTPRLAGARIRKAQQGGVELVVPSPSGSRGSYVIPWSGISALCHPTVHDTMLYRGIGRLPAVDPVRVRDVALEVAASGFAGRAAMAAAAAVREQDRAARQLTHVLLVAELLEQAEPGGAQLAEAAERTAAFDQRAGEVLARIAPSLGCPPAHLAISLAALGKAFAPVGIAPVGIAGDDRAMRMKKRIPGRIPGLIDRLDDCYVDLMRWLTQPAQHDVVDLGQSLAAAMKMAADDGRALLAATRAALANPMGLLKRFLADADATLGLALRCDWLLDGWERVCLLWQTAATPVARRTVLLEVAQLLPMLPDEAADWLDRPVQPEPGRPAFRVISHDETWRSGGAACVLIQRNEQLRVIST